MTGIVEFLTARLDEDEAGAHSSGPARVAWLTYRKDSGEMLYTTVAAEVCHGDVWIADGHELAPPASAMVVYDPARVLAEVAAKRRMLGAAIEMAKYETSHVAADMIMRNLAAPYDQHPEFKQAWRML